MYLTMILAVLLHSCSAEAQIRMTLLGINPFESEVNSQFQCHSESDLSVISGASLKSFRAGWTRDSLWENLEPPEPHSYPNDPFPHHKIFLRHYGNNSGFGVFGCRIKRGDNFQNVISTVRMRSDADITPVNQLVTQTVNIGDEGVNITMNINRTKNGQTLIWKHNNDTVAERQSASDTSTLTIDGPIGLNHSGIYECHVDGERKLAKHGLNLLLVRACPANRWGPDCHSVCNSCYNGGICDENNGKCVCAPGFMGDNCLQVCGGNKYGHTCDIKCSRTDGEVGCRYHQFCLVHPFGCRCNTGWKGLACNEACSSNTFGASCLQSCHCVSNECDEYTGECRGSDTNCKTGWTGDNCQECDGNLFGINCSQECHCTKDKCNIETGLCKRGGCLPQWVDLYPPYSCQTGLQNITYSTLKVNHGASANVSCTAVKGPKGDLESLDLVLSREEDNLQQGNITPVDSEDNDATKIRNFTVANVQRGDMFYCQLRDSNGSKLAVLGHNNSFDVYDLPELKTPPTNHSVGSTLIIIKWLAWDNTTDTGDPPVVGYLPYHKKTEENDWVPSPILPSKNLMYTFTGLDPDTNYSFSVAAVREGDGGEGPKSPQLDVRTICKVPPSPENLKTATEKNLVNISWQIPPSDDLGCSSGIIKFTIYFFSSGTEIVSRDVTDPKATSFILHNLTDTVSYTFYITLTTAGGESNESPEIHHHGDSAGELHEGSPAPLIAVSVFSVLFVIVLAVLVVFLLCKRRRRNRNLHTTTAVYEKPGPRNKGYTPSSVNGMPATFHREDVDAEEEEGQDDNQGVYTNIEKPVSIPIADLEKYLSDCESSKTRNLEQQFLLLNGGKQFDNLVGAKEENQPKNRFKNMIAYDHSRVVLPLIDGNPHSDYYNANYVKNLDGEVAFIASQGPNKASVNDFWRMVLMADVHHIAMLTNLVEGGKNRCIQYWPLAVGRTKRFGKIDVKLEKEEQFADYDIRELNVELGDQSRKVTNWHFKTWPDKNIPDQPSPLIDFTNKVKSLQQTCSGPLLVHCSAGVGRTGTFIALYSLSDAVKHGDRIDIYGFVEQMRQNRIRMVQTGLQYKFLHECLLEIYLTGDTQIPLNTMETINFSAERGKLKEQFKMLAKLNQRSAKPHSFSKEEYKKCRYPEIIPVDKKRPFLQSPGKATSSNFINACVVPSYRKTNAFIATQSPLPNTVEDFWRLVYDWNCPLIVMLNQLDPHDMTCCKYWPESGSSQFGHINVKLKDEQDMNFYSIFRQFDITYSYDKVARSVFQLQLKKWDTNKLRDIISLIKDMGKLQQDNSMVTPTVVHCINGVGRTGVFLAVKSEMERYKIEGSFDIFTTVTKLRGSNPSMVYTEEDYYICHQLLKLDYPESEYANV